MSTRGSLFLTKNGNHWYEDFATLSPDSTPERRIPNIHISISDEDIVLKEYCEIEETWFFEIDGNSELAKKIRNARE